MTAKEKVLEVWPDTIVYGNKILWKWLWYRELDPDKVSGQFDTEEAAWQNAAESLPAPCMHEWVGGPDEATHCDLCGMFEPVAPVEAKEKCLHCSETIERGVGGLWYSSSTASTCYENRGGGGHTPVAEPKPTPSELTITVPRDIAHGLWCAGGKLRSDLSASLALSPENWHEEGLRQQLDKWDAAAERYFDFALSGKSQPDSSIPDELSVPSRNIAKELIDELFAWQVAHLDSTETIQVGETPVEAAIRLMKSQKEELSRIRDSSSIPDKVRDLAEAISKREPISSPSWNDACDIYDLCGTEQSFGDWWRIFNKSDFARAFLGIGTEKAPYGSSEYFTLKRCAESTWNAAKGQSNGR